jgi:hypothetical protein
MTDPEDTVDESSTRLPRRSRRRVALVVAIGAALVLGIAYGIWWRIDRRYVGTDVAAELSWGECLNGIGWTDPSNGGAWWAGHDIVVTGDYESEPVRARTTPSGNGPDRPARGLLHSSVGTIHFDTYDRATFTSRSGGTMQLIRPPRNQAYTADCVLGGHRVADHRPPSTVVWAEISGALGRQTSRADEIVLAKGMVYVEQDGVEIEAIPLDGRTTFLINVPIGTVTLRGTDDRGMCGVVTVTVAAGDHVSRDLTCEQP